MACLRASVPEIEGYMRKLDLWITTNIAMKVHLSNHSALQTHVGKGQKQVVIVAAEKIDLLHLPEWAFDRKPIVNVFPLTLTLTSTQTLTITLNLTLHSKP